VIGWFLNEFIQKNTEPLGQIGDGNLSTRLDMLMECISIIDKEFRHFNIKVLAPVRTVCVPTLRLLSKTVYKDDWRSALEFGHQAEREKLTDSGLSHGDGSLRNIRQ
jgi:hypothetical protein